MLVKAWQTLCHFPKRYLSQIYMTTCAVVICNTSLHLVLWGIQSFPGLNFSCLTACPHGGGLNPGQLCCSTLSLLTMHCPAHSESLHNESTLIQSFVVHLCLSVSAPHVPGMLLQHLLLRFFYMHLHQEFWNTSCLAACTKGAPC